MNSSFLDNFLDTTQMKVPGHLTLPPLTGASVIGRRYAPLFSNLNTVSIHRLEDILRFTLDPLGMCISSLAMYNSKLPEVDLSATFWFAPRILHDSRPVDSRDGAFWH